MPIVIVDDTAEDALLAHRVFAQCKIRNPITLLNGGAACLEYFSEMAAFESRKLPCLLLLDVMMPVVSGIDVLTGILAGKMGEGSLVVMLSGITELKTIHRGYQLGAKTFLIKPITTQDVVHMLNSLPELEARHSPEGYELALRTAEQRSDPRRTGSQIRAFHA
jgi:CheY-like chemotaxis protein